MSLAFGVKSSFRVKGLVEDGKHQPIASVEVLLKYGNNQVRHATTDVNGIFELTNIAGSGPYVFTFTHPGFTTQTLTKYYFDTTKAQSF